MSISPLTQKQITKVLKALGYSFASTFIATLLLVPSLEAITERTVMAAFVAGINAVLVTVKQLFSEE